MNTNQRITAATIGGVQYSGDDPKIGELNRLRAALNLIATAYADSICADYMQSIARTALGRDVSEH